MKVNKKTYSFKSIPKTKMTLLFKICIIQNNNLYNAYNITVVTEAHFSAYVHK